MRNLAFWFRKNPGRLKLLYFGFPDMALSGEGFPIAARVTLVGKDGSSVLKAKSADIQMVTLKFSNRNSNHDLLHKTLYLLAIGLSK
jgi:hypothetical protein